MLIESEIIVENEKSKNEELLTYSRYLSGTIKKFSSRVYELNDNYLSDMDRIYSLENNLEKEDSINEDLFLEVEQMAKDAENRYADNVLDDYNRILGNITIKLKSLIENVLKYNGYNYEVAISIKLFDKIFREGITAEEITVYTAFRDFDTFCKGEREVCRKEYCINENSDFIHCLRKEMYIINGIDSHEGSYCNENEERNKFYDSAITTAIFYEYNDYKRIFGYLACDVLVGDDDISVFDNKIGNIMYITAMELGSYFDTLSYAWEYTIDQYDDILDFIYSNKAKLLK
jgi:hypothetical protein